MICQFCKTHLNNGDDTGYYQCSNCVIPKVTYICSGSSSKPKIDNITFKINEHLYLDLDYYKSKTTIWIVPSQAEPSRKVASVNNIIEGITPHNVEGIAERILKLMVFA